jgi:putative PEP-CTERM system TPR-repeat lipoprotein
MNKRYLCVALLLLATAACSSNDPDTLIKRARQDMAAGQWQEAYVRLKGASQKRPDDIGIRLLLAQAAYAQGNVAAAATELTKMDLAAIPDADGQILKLRIDIQSGNAREALAALPSANKLSRDQQDWMRGMALRATGAIEDSIRQLSELTSRASEAIDYRLELIESLMAAGRSDDARKEIEKALQAHPSNPDALVARAQLELAAGLPATAVRTLESAQSTAPKDWPPARRNVARYLQGDGALRVGNLADAKKASERLSKDAPALIATVLLRARIAKQEGRFEDALVDLQKIAPAAPGNAPVQILLADTLVQARKFEQAQTVLEELVVTSPDSLEARKLLARMYLAKNRPDKIIDLLGNASPAQAADPDVQQLMSAAQSVQSRAAEAVDSLQARLLREPANSQIKLQLANAYVTNGLPAEALKILDTMPAAENPPLRTRLRLLAFSSQSNKRAVEQEIDSLLAAANLPVMHLLVAADTVASLGRGDLAMRLLDVAKKREPDNVSVYVARAGAQMIDRRTAAAEAELRDYLSRHPRDTQVRVALARVLTSANNVEGARGLLNGLLAESPGAMQPSALLASIELQAGRTADAVRILDAAVAAAPRDGAAAAAAGNFLLSARHPAEAVPFLTLATQQKSDASYFLRLSQALSATGKTADARATLAQVLRLDPKNVEARVALAGLEILDKRAGSALTTLDSVDAKASGRVDVLVARADALLSSGRGAEAYELYRRAFDSARSPVLALQMFKSKAAANMPQPEQPLKMWLQISPRDRAIRLTLAQYLMQTGDNTGAVAAYEELVQLFPRDAVALNNLAWLLSDRSPERAEQLARTAIEAAPAGQPQIVETLASILAKRGKLPEAVRLYGTVIDKFAQDGSVLYRYADALARSGDRDQAKLFVARSLETQANFAERTAAEQLAAQLR